MRKDRFVEQFKTHLPYLRNIAMKAGLDYDDANEAVGQCVTGLFNSKKYCIIEPAKLKAFLYARIRFTVQHYKRDEVNHKVECARLADPEFTYTADSKVNMSTVVALEPIVEVECPFCFHANLNEYGACHMCHTIVPSHIRVHRNTIVMTEESLAVEFDFNTKIDVEKAIARLTPFEQKVIRACGLGNESLESFALDTAFSKTTIVRVWLEAKAKLQESLSEYATNSKHRSTESFRKAVRYALPKTNC